MQGRRAQASTGREICQPIPDNHVFYAALSVIWHPQHELSGQRRGMLFAGRRTTYSRPCSTPPPAAAMTTQPLRPPIPLHLQPSAKASSTAKSSNLSAIAGTTPTSSRSSSHARPVKQRQNVPKTDFTSENATLSLIRRVLSPQNGHPSDQRGTPRPTEDLLPPLTSFNEVDIQLYAIIAIVLKDFVYAWYGKITPDHVFVEEIIQIIAHTTRALEQRLRRIDLEGLVLDEIPAVVTAHVLGEDVLVVKTLLC